MDKEAILAPYRNWQMSKPLLQIINESNAKVGHPNYMPNIITINGPKESGKSYTVDWLKKRGFGFEVMTLTGRLYMAMRFDKLPDTNRSYEEFKALPYGRERLIEASERLKEKLGPLIWCQLLLALQGFQTGNTILVDNIGFWYEADFFKQCATKLAGIRFFESFSGHTVPTTDAGNWVGDSRSPVDFTGTVICKNSIAFEFWMESQIATWNTHRADVHESCLPLLEILMPTYMGKQESMTFD